MKNNRKLQQLGNEGWTISFSSDSLTKNFTIWLELEPEVFEVIDVDKLISLEYEIVAKQEEIRRFFNETVRDMIKNEIGEKE